MSTLSVKSFSMFEFKIAGASAYGHGLEYFLGRTSIEA